MCVISFFFLFSSVPTAVKHFFFWFVTYCGETFLQRIVFCHNKLQLVW